MSPVLVFLSCLSLTLADPEGGVGGFVNDLGKGIGKEVADLKHPVEEVVVNVLSSQCSNVKKLTGLAYEQVKGQREPDLNELKLRFITNDYNITYNINTAARDIPESKFFNPQQKLYIFCHGFNDNPSSTSFSTISTPLLARGECNVLGLDGSTLIRWFYLRSTTYVRYIGEKLGEVLAALVQGGVDPDDIHVIGHSLGAHVSGFTGKSFTDLTGLQVGRITGLDPAGPCFTDIAEELRLKASDAKFVDVMHTDGGVLGLTNPIGDVDYFPNEGSQQPNCFLQSCSHSRAWMYFGESVSNPVAFAAVKCASWNNYKNGTCEDGISYMGFPSEPGTKGQYYLRTTGESPFGLGLNGTVYKKDQGIVKNILQDNLVDMRLALFTFTMTTIL